MIFAILVFSWVFTATTILMLLPPVVLVIMRGSYLDRNLFPRIQWIPILSALVIFLYLLAISEKTISTALLQAGKILASSVILIHFSLGLLRDWPAYAGVWLGTLFILIQRCLILEKRIASNAIYNFQTRLRHSKIRFREACGLIGGLILTITGELLRLSEEMRRLYKSRGSNSVSLGWMIPSTRKIPATIGDIILVLIIALGLGVGLDGLIPEQMATLYSTIFQ